MTVSDQQSFQRLIALLETGERIFVLTGAGCSTASGLGDYRDRHGRWKRKQPITGQDFVRDPVARKRYWARSYVGWPAFSTARPSLAHRALARLESSGRLLTLVTQNVDGLHQKAGHRDVVELHGALRDVTCLDCGQRVQRDQVQQQLQMANSWLADLSADLAPDGDADLENEVVLALQEPRCGRCGGLQKPDVVFFGENVPRSTVQHLSDTLPQADAMLVVGSSLMVFSGYRFCRMAAQAGIPIAIVNDGLTRADDLASIKVSGDCGIRLDAAIDSALALAG